MPSYRLPLIAAAASLALLATGCGADKAATSGSSTPPSPTATSALVSPPSGAAATSRTQLVKELLAAIDAKTSVHLAVVAGAMGSGTADISYGAGGTRIRVLGTVDGKRTMFVIANGVVYVQQGTGGKYLMVDKNDPNYGTLLRTFTNIGPHESVAGLGKGITAVTDRGTTTIDGATVTDYRISVDPSKATGAFKALAGTSGISQLLTFDMYVAADHLLRRLSAAIDGSVTTVDLTDWNKQVTISVPSKNDQITALG